MSEIQRLLRRLPKMLSRLPHHFLAEQGILNSAALTYTTLFSLVPLMTLSYAMLALVPSFQGLGTQLENWIFSNFLPDTGTQIQSSLSQFAAQARSLTLVGVLFLFLTALLMMRNIEAALNRIWQVRSQRRFISSLLIYWAVVTLGPLLIGLGLALSSYLYGWAQLDRMGAVSDWLVLLPWCLTALAFALIYTVVPDAPVPWRAALISGVLAALAFELSKRGFSLFVTHFPSYRLIYGAFAAVPIFLVWVFICWSIFLAGATLCRLLSAPESGDHRPVSRLYRVLKLLAYLAHLQLSGRQARPVELINAIEGLGARDLEWIWQQLAPLELLARDDQGRWMLKRDLHQVRLREIDQLCSPDQSLPVRGEEHWEYQLNEWIGRLNKERAALLDLTLAELFFGSDRYGNTSDTASVD